MPFGVRNMTPERAICVRETLRGEGGDMAGRPATRYAKSGDVHIGYQVFGDGREDLVYVPTWWSNVDAQWDVPEIAEFLTRLSSFCRVIVFDKRGGGISDPVPLSSLPTLEEWMDEDRKSVVEGKRVWLGGGW